MSDPSTTTAPAPEFDVMNPPDHTQLPDKDGAIVNNAQEHPQSELLTTSLAPRLLEIQPDGQFVILEDVGIYWRYTQPVLAGCKSPDWYCVLGVPPMLNDQIRRSYVLWNEGVAPLLVVEYVSGDGSEEHDRTAHTGKFWVYERGIRASFYAIFDGFRGTLEVSRLSGGGYQNVEANERGRYPIDPLKIELGLWQGQHRFQNGIWLRAWDATSGEMLPSGAEMTERERLRANTERQRAETAEELLDDTRQLLNEETERTTRLAEKLRALGIDPDAA